MDIKEVPVTQIRPYENNPRNNKDAVEYVANSIREFGFKQPIVVDKDGVIVVGHTRYAAAKQIGMKSVPVLYADDLTPQQIDAYRLADNKTNELATWDFSKLNVELENLLDFNMEDFGFDIAAGLEEEIIEDEIPEAVTDEPAICSGGQVWALGRHKLMCGDSTKEADVAKLMDGEEADLWITDPPYNVNYTGGTKEKLTIENDNMESEKFKEFLTHAFSVANHFMKAGASFYVWFASREHVNFELALNASSLQVRQELLFMFGLQAGNMLILSLH